MRSLTGRFLFYLLSLSLLLLLFFGVSPSLLYLRFFILFFHLNINIISFASISNIMITGQELIRVSGGQSITSVDNAIRYLDTIFEAFRFIY
jgi:hypothetical protein